jgi:nicotinamide-nucleotide amidase
VDVDKLAEAVGDEAGRQHLRVAVAESLTGGMVSSALARANDAGTWFAGGIVAYGSDVKHELLAVPPGPVVSAEAAQVMADSTRRLLRADVAVALTGAGGPDPQDGQPPGTVFLAVATPGTVWTKGLNLPGEPAEVCQGAVEAALMELRAALDVCSSSGTR